MHVFLLWPDVCGNKLKLSAVSQLRQARKSLTASPWRGTLQRTPLPADRRKDYDLTASKAARGLVITTSALLFASTVTMASQTYRLSSGASRRTEPTRFQTGIEHRSAANADRNPWIINSSFEIDDPDDPGAPPQPARAGSSRAVSIARMYRGTRYVWGGTTSRGFDCSGFVRYVYARLGHSLPRTASEQFHVGKRVSYTDLRPGDILFFHTSRRGVSHVGIYVGNNNFIHAANPRKGVTINSLSGYYARRLVGARRIQS